jgi:hypothetical protein
MFENRHLNDHDYKEAIRLLKSYGYVIGSYYKDTIAVGRHLLPYIAGPQ